MPMPAVFSRRTDSAAARRIVPVVYAVFCFVLSTGPHTGQGAEPSKPNILFLFSDDQRPDTIAALGNREIQTPHLDQLVRRGTTFTRAITANPICTPSRGEVLTGCNGFRNGVLDFGRRLDPELPTWAGTLRRAGYHTWYVGKWHNDGRPVERGYEQTRGLYAGGGGRWAVPSFDWNGRLVTGYRGWVFQDDDGTMRPELGVGLTPNISERFADAAISFLREETDRPFFLHVNFPAPHDPLLMPFGYEGRYDPAKISIPGNFLPEHPLDHGNFRGRDERLFEWPRTKQEVRNELAVYYAVITHMDAQIGRILKALEETGQSENTIVIFSSDHGLGLGSHGIRGKQNMYEHTIGVPLILAGPQIPENRRIDAQCYLRDLFPTTCDLAGVPIPDPVQGRSLKPLLRGEVEEIYPEVFAYFRNFQRMIRTDEWKLIEYPQIGRQQLFHLTEDPLERNDLSKEPRHAKKLAELEKRLHTWQGSQQDPARK